MTSLTASSAKTTQPARRKGLPPVLHYTVHSAGITVRNFSFLIFSVGMPVVLYLVFSKIFGSEDAGYGVTYNTITMVSMAAYGSLGAAMSGGAQVAVERRSGWFRQLMITTLPPRAFLWSKAAVIMLIVLPALILVFIAGFVIGDVRAPAWQWLASLGLMWISLVPLTVLGITIGLWFKAEAVQGVTTLLLLLLSMLGGLWFPSEIMPQVMQQIAKGLPSYWLGQLGRYPFLEGANFPWPGVIVLAGWTVVLTVLGALGFRRAAQSSKR